VGVHDPPSSHGGTALVCGGVFVVVVVMVRKLIPILHDLEGRIIAVTDLFQQFLVVPSSPPPPFSRPSGFISILVHLFTFPSHKPIFTPWKWRKIIMQE